ncbi:MAG: PepSY-like domain-containing protein [Bacteroidetes bacterium]|nr:PepSY-like domain-containing protein [Bacteroidota bacterium]
MKKKLITVIITNVLSIGLFAQENHNKMITPPDKVKAAFAEMFAGTSKVKWEKEGNNYEVNFVQHKKEMSAVYDNNGIWKETEEKIAVAALPPAAVSYIKTHYNGAKIKEAAKITRSGGMVNYEAEVNKMDVILDTQGNFIKEEKDND